MLSIKSSVLVISNKLYLYSILRVYIWAIFSQIPHHRNVSSKWCYMQRCSLKETIYEAVMFNISTLFFNKGSFFNFLLLLIFLFFFCFILSNQIFFLQFMCFRKVFEVNWKIKKNFIMLLPIFIFLSPFRFPSAAFIKQNASVQFYCITINFYFWMFVAYFILWYLFIT